MHIIRFTRPDTGATGVGVLLNGHVTQMNLPGLPPLLTLPLDRIRRHCLGADGPRYARGEIRVLPPVDGRMEVWAAGVTYQDSRLARMKESDRAASVYEQVYDAPRPELFFKSAAWRVVGDGEPVSVREDSRIDVPEPELALVLNALGEVVGYTICDDVSSRSIEGENPLYLPQAKTYLGGCAVGPAIRPVWEIADPCALDIEMTISREDTVVWQGTANTDRLHRGPAELAGFLFRADAFPDGVVLSTGTCLVPELPFTLHSHDIVRITIQHLGTLVNEVVRGRNGMEWLVTTATDPHRRPTATL